MVRNACFAYAAAGFALAMAIRLGDGSANALVQGWYRPVLLASVAVLIGLAGFVSIQLIRTRQEMSLRFTRGGVVMGALVVVPIVLGIAYKPEPLGSGSIDIETDASSRAFAASARSADPAQRNLYQWAYAFELLPAQEVVGQPVDLVAFVFHPRESPGADRFLAARFVVACCVADARGFTLPVQWPQAGALATDAWVRIKGRVGTGKEGDLVILAEAVEHVDAPTNPYIYP